MPGFDAASAKRISRSVLWSERMQGIPSTDPNENYSQSTSSICLVRTGTTLPAGYTGAMAALGDVVEKQPDGTINSLGAVWIKDINGGTLSANTIYQARVGGTYAQDLTTNGVTASTTLGLYLVQKGGSSSLIYEPFRLTGVSNGNLVGLSLDGTRSQVFGSAAAMGPQIAQVITRLGVQIFGSGVFTTDGTTSSRYIVNPFTFQADTYYYASAYTGDIVTCGVPTYGGSSQYFFDAFDPLQLVRANGYYCRAILSYGTTVSGRASQNPFTVIAARKTDTYTTSGISTGIGSGISGV